MSKLNRRSFLKAVGIGAGAAVGTRLAGPGFMGDAAAQMADGSPHLLLIHLQGGYNALFGSADSFMGGTFAGVTAGNVFQVPNGGPVVDASLGRLPPMARNKIVSVGVFHRQSAHGAAQAGGITEGGACFPVQLAAAMGGQASIKCATVGGGSIQGMTGTAGNVSIQNIADVRSTIAALQGNDTLPDRAISGRALEGSQAMSAGRLADSPKGLEHLKDGYDTVTATLKKAPAPYAFDRILPAYGVNGTAVSGFAAKIAAAELMIRSGTNVVMALDGGWDSHGDRQGTNVRNMMNTRIIPPLITFFDRLWVNNTEGVPRNVVVCSMGDFARSAPGSDHANGVCATVIGTRTKPGTTGKVTNTVGFNPNLPSGKGLYQMLAAALKVQNSPFGANTAHAALIG